MDGSSPHCFTRVVRLRGLRYSRHMTDDERGELLTILAAHLRTVDVCQACAETTRDLAAEVKRGGMPSREDLATTITEAEHVLQDLRQIRTGLEQMVRAVGEG
jgi:hypothetical protein